MRLKKYGGHNFHDGDANEESHSEGPKLLHYRSATIKDVIERQSVTWKRILQGKIELPTSKVYLYDSEGNPAGELIYPLQPVAIMAQDHIKERTLETTWKERG